jgi:hypothetical protein
MLLRSGTHDSALIDILLTSARARFWEFQVF